MSAHAQPTEFVSSTEIPRKRLPALRMLQAFARTHALALSLIAAFILVYALVGFFLVPYAVQKTAERYVIGELGARIDIGQISFNPFTLQALARDVALRERDATPLLSFRRLHVDASIASVWRRSLVLTHIGVEEPFVNLVIEQNGKFNLAQLAPPTKSSQSDGTPRVWIESFEIANGRLDFEDRERTVPFKIAFNAVEVALTDFRTDAQHRNAYAVSATSEHGERLAWQGDFTVEPIFSRGQFSITDLQAKTLDQYRSQEWPFHLISGTATLNGTYQMAFEQTLSLNVELPQLSIANLGFAEELASDFIPVVIPTLHATHASYSYETDSLSVQRVHIAGAQASVLREPDGSFNVLRLFGLEEEASLPATEVSNTEAERSASVRVDELVIDESVISAEDRTIDPAVKVEFSPASFIFKNLTTQPDEPIAVEAHVVVAKEGRIDAAGTVTPEPLAFDIALELTDVALPVLQPYIAQATALTLHSGNLGAKATIASSTVQNSDAAMRFEGDVRISDLRTTDRQLNEELVKWRDLALRGIRFSTNPNKLAINQVVARQPYARVIIAADQSLNIAKVLQPSAVNGASNADEHTASAQPEASSNFETRIGSIQIVDGAVNFADHSIQPVFAAGILDLHGTIEGLSSRRDTRGKVALEGKVDQYAPVKITGEVNLLSAAMYTDLALSFQNMELTTFNPYSGKFAGYNITKGKLSTELRYKVDDRKLDAQHHIILDNLEFGAPTDSKDAAPIPLKLAVALLKDRNGVIDLNVPVGGSLDDPQFRLGPIIWKAFVGLLTKIVTAPFAAIGALFGGGEELAFIDFPAGSAELSSAENEKIAKVAAALVDRPQLRVDIPLTVVSNEDANSLARQSLAAKEEAPAEVQDEAAQRKVLAQLETIYKSELGTAPTYPPETKTERGIDWSARIEWMRARLLEELQPDAATLEALARQRAQAVQSAIMANTQIAPERVFITNERQASLVSGGAVRMEMKLE